MALLHLKNIETIAGSNGEASTITVSDGRIVDIGEKGAAEADTIDCTGLTLFPGFVDMHIHGAVGCDVNAADTDGLMEIATFLATHGVTSWVPTLVPDSDENYARVIATIDRLMEVQTAYPVAQAVGVHYEGVFASEKMCGALRPEFFKTYTGGELGSLPKLRTGVHMMTFAPEIDGGVDLAADLDRNGWIASIGHTRASVEILDAAFEHGARHLTHFYNAMTGLHHRELGVVGWAFSKPDVGFDIIADGIHVEPRMLGFACQAKGATNVSLISDSVAPTGLGDGTYEIWGERVSVDAGRTRNERGSIAGSVITMLDAAKQMLSLGFSTSEVAMMASLNPARTLRIESTRGSVEVGKRADLVAIDRDGKVRFTLIAGAAAGSL